MADGARSFPAAWRPLAVLAAAALAAAALAVAPPKTVAGSAGPGGGGPLAAPAGQSGESAGLPGGDGIANAAGADPGAAARGSTGGRTADAATTGATGGALACAAGQNGGATDVGVTGTSIKLGATVVDSGIGAAFLRDARHGMLAVKNRVNREGGICGRTLDLLLKDDGWDRGRGKEFIRNLVEDERVFALAVVPSSEGLDEASGSGYITEQRVPVVGSDGMLKSQYTDPYVWPVAASTISTMHVAAKAAYDSPTFHARNFGIVYEFTYRFGREGADALNGSVKRLTGSNLPGYTSGNVCQERFCGISAEDGDYSTEIQTFNSACSKSPRCDYVVLLLEPTTALKWIQQGGLVLGGGRTAGPQPLFTRAFAEQCKEKCHGMWLWTGYLPAIGANLGRPAVAHYRDEVAATSSSADVTNTFVEGAYLGMELLVEALGRVGPNLTRERLAAVLDSMTLPSGLTTTPLRWQGGNHFANVTMQAYSIQFTDRFSGWRDEQVVLADPWIGADI